MTIDKARHLQWIDLGYCEYREAFRKQEEIHRACVAGEIPDTLIFQESSPVISLGRGYDKSHLLLPVSEIKELGIDILEVSRGGDISYHGPGQLVVSPVLHLTDYVKNAIQYVRNLESVIISVLEHYGINGERLPEFSGVWVRSDDRLSKIAALGVSISHGVTCHGFSININPEMSHFETIIPCGIRDLGVTSMAMLGVYGISINDVRDQVIKTLASVFGDKETMTIKTFV